MDDRLSCPTAQPFGSQTENVWNPIFYLQMQRIKAGLPQSSLRPQS